MVTSASVQQFLTMAQTLPIIDVRTPAEFAKAHIPGAYNLPLFSNDERARVGTTYKQQGREQAMLLGLELTGIKLRSMVEQVQQSIHNKSVLLHCWRGGMRSQSVAWLLDFFGYKVTTLHGGYKAFRSFVANTWDIPRELLIISGKTGSGKTRILRELQMRGEPAIDLEALAHHKGSSFGRIGENTIVSQEHFENALALQLRRTNPSVPVWLEDESRRIGWVQIPLPLWQQMSTAPLLFLDIPTQQRIHNLIHDYGGFDKNDIAEAIIRLTKRLGGAATQHALQALEQNNLRDVCATLLYYYDKTYLYGLSRRNPHTVQKIAPPLHTPESIANLLIGHKKSMLQNHTEFGTTAISAAPDNG